MQACGALSFPLWLWPKSTADNITNDSILNDWETQTKDGSDVELQLLANKRPSTFILQRRWSHFSHKNSDTHRQNTTIDSSRNRSPNRRPSSQTDYRFVSLNSLACSQNNVSERDLTWLNQDEILYDGMRGDPFSGFSIPQLFTIWTSTGSERPSLALCMALVNLVALSTTSPKNRRMNRKNDVEKSVLETKIF